MTFRPAAALRRLQHRPLLPVLVALYFLLAPTEDFLSGRLDNVLVVLSIGIGLLFLYELMRDPNRTLEVSSFTVVLPLALVFLANASFLWTIDPAVTLARNVAYTTLPLVFMLMVNRVYTPEDRALIEGACLGSVFILAGLVHFFPAQRTAELNRLTLSEVNDPNNLAAFMMVPLAISLGWVLQARGWRLVVALASSATATWVVLSSGSRGGLLALSAAFGVLAWHSVAQLRARTLLRLGALGLVLLALALYGVPTLSLERMLGLDQYTRDLTSYGSRSDIWRVVIDQVLSRSNLMGLGSGCAPEALAAHFGRLKAVHNTYLNMVVEYGLFGLPLLLALVAQSLRSALRRQDLSALVTLAAILVAAFFLDSYPKKFFWNALTYACLFMKSGAVHPLEEVRPGPAAPGGPPSSFSGEPE